MRRARKNEEAGGQEAAAGFLTLPAGKAGQFASSGPE